MRGEGDLYSVLVGQSSRHEGPEMSILSPVDDEGGEYLGRSVVHS